MRSRSLALTVLLLAVLACNLGRAAPAQQMPAPIASEAVSQPGIPVAATPIWLVIPEGLATGASAETIDVVTDQTGAPWDVAPAHLQLTFEGYSLGTSFHVPQLFVYPAGQYAGMHPAAAVSLKRLQAVLADPSASYNKDTLPRIPFLNAGQVLAAQEKVIHFTGGSGVRFITQYGQDIAPINNSGLFYDFAGLSDDGKYYIIAILPINVAFLAADGNPDSPVPAGGIPFPASSAPGSSFEAYYRQITERIDAAPAGQFTPPLSTLDALIESITFGH